MKQSKWILGVATFLCSAQCALAQDAHTELATILSQQQSQLMKTLLGRDFFDNIMASMEGAFPKSESGKFSEAREALKPIMEKAFVRMGAAMSSPEATDLLRAMIEKSLRANYTLDESKAFADFYRTPIGASISAKSAPLAATMMKEMPAIQQRFMQPIMQEMMAEIEKLARERKANSN